MKNLKTNLLKAGIIALGLQPIISNAQWTTPPTTPNTNILQNNADVGILGIKTFEFGVGVAGKDISAGKIGYGTFTPGSLDIVGAGTGSNRKIRFWNENGATFGGPIIVSGDINLGSEYNLITIPVALGVGGGITGDDGQYKRLTLYHGYNIAFETGSNSKGVTNTRMLIDQSGNVGIGTVVATPRAKLDINGAVIIGTNKPAGLTPGTNYMLSVDGKIYCQELNVTPSGSPNWLPDYVFKSDYKLASLAEVEAYIKEKGHLKDVPSAEEVSKTGYKVGEMDATLLRKIEELTLYMLAQQKEIEGLKAQINK